MVWKHPMALHHPMLTAVAESPGMGLDS
ncbi:uncharacterized protein METZ01_LOCUS99955 [marine metagenome]|uniref:Uncharacterized protein n=1 Tax=marine metagenome TaxID=408172 RepID=A0A381W430_9ZZZZ